MTVSQQGVMTERKARSTNEAFSPLMANPNLSSWLISRDDGSRKGSQEKMQRRAGVREGFRVFRDQAQAFVWCIGTWVFLR